MDNLENDINKIMDDLNQIWVNAVEEAEKNGEGLNSNVLFGKYSEIVLRKEKAFQDAKIRLKDIGKKKFLGL